MKPLYAAQAEKKAQDDARAAQEAEAQRQADILASQQAAVVQVAYNPHPVVQPSGSCSDWINAAGITDTRDAMTLINWESGCNPNIYNGAGSGACGVAQELPCGKSGCALGDGACQVRWMNEYVLERYGSWANAVAFHISNGWY